MDFELILLLVMWPLGAYQGWQTLTAKNNEWLNTMEPLNLVVKVSMCVVLGLFFALGKIIKFALNVVFGMIRLFSF